MNVLAIGATGFLGRGVGRASRAAVADPASLLDAVGAALERGSFT